ncbi:hypothetical protein AWL63_18405 [Sphingomonas panacis]|uniref:PDZ domain-containing protein n=1 Tax=Sphingomonas panacis TaxID=1560345 RepID=A0A1B3ZDW6_9SPHN|nr:aspartyl protease family protein [Sphingomonas panacis]AOH85614.1 hypothetical protein AWL63_18405 [Sphingomonas panacis]
MRRSLHGLLAIALILSANPAATQPADVDFRPVDAAGHGPWTPFAAQAGGAPAVTAAINGRQVSAILDTGAGFSIASPQTVRALGLSSQGTVTVDTVAGPVEMTTVGPVTIELGNYRVERKAILAQPAPATAQRAVAVSDLVIGRDVLTCCALEIDHDRNRFRFAAAIEAQPRQTRHALQFTPGRADMVLHAGISGNPRLKLIVDLGFDGELMLASHGWQSFPSRRLKITDTLVGGLGGPVLKKLAILPELDLGGRRIRNVETYLEDTNGYADARGVDGIIGARLLARFNPAFDVRHGILALTDRRGAPVPRVKSTSGVVVLPEGDRLHVLHIMQGSPAARSPLKPGDLICRVNGRPIPEDYYKSDLRKWSIDTPGKTVSLDLCDGRYATLVLRDFY